LRARRLSLVFRRKVLVRVVHSPFRRQVSDWEQGMGRLFRVMVGLASWVLEDWRVNL